MNLVKTEDLGAQFLDAYARRAQVTVDLDCIVAESEYPLPTQDHFTTPGYPETWEELQAAHALLSKLNDRLSGRIVTFEALDPETQPIALLQRGRGVSVRPFEKSDAVVSRPVYF